MQFPLVPVIIVARTVGLSSYRDIGQGIGFRQRFGNLRISQTAMDLRLAVVGNDIAVCRNGGMWYPLG